MALRRNNSNDGYGTRPYGLHDKIRFGMMKGYTIKEIIDDAGTNLIEYYLKHIDNFRLDDEAIGYMNYKY